MIKLYHKLSANYQTFCTGSLVYVPARGYFLQVRSGRYFIFGDMVLAVGHRSFDVDEIRKNHELVAALLENESNKYLLDQL